MVVKREKKVSNQGSSEFKAELEMLSRVHHKNLVGLLRFFSEERNQMLVYEYMPNRSLRDKSIQLTCKTIIFLDW